MSLAAFSDTAAAFSTKAWVNAALAVCDRALAELVGTTTLRICHVSNVLRAGTRAPETRRSAAVLW